MLGVAVISTYLVACSDTPAEPLGSADVVISVESTGGIAGIRLEIDVFGDVQRIHWFECLQAACSHEGDSIELTEDEVQEIVARFVGAGILDLSDEDFGVCAQCADQFHHVITFEDKTGTRHARGDDVLMPAELVSAIEQLIEFVRERGGA